MLQVVPIHNNGDLKETQKNIEDYRRVWSYPQLTTSRSFAKNMMQPREQRGMKAIGKATEAAREGYEGYLYNNELKRTSKDDK